MRDSERALYAEISRMARKDQLTGLPNRALLYERIDAAIASADRLHCSVGLLFLGLDRFRHVNDSLGHVVGDWLLESVALRLTACVRGTDTVSRPGGDEFVILLSEIETEDDARIVAAKVLAGVNGVHRVAQHEIHLTTSIGISVYPPDGSDAETLLKNAHIAMQYAKDRGRNNLQFFAHDMHERLLERRTIEDDLRRAISRNELVLYYQPKVDLQTGRIVGAEALLRWRHPKRGLMGPEQFVPVAQDSGLILPIGEWVLREACRQEAEWRAAGLDPVPVAINVCTTEFRSKGFVERVRRTLDETGIDPRLLEFELTEGVLMESVGEAADALRELKAMGLRIAVDDFGTGYSSLSYLTQLPIDALKVDQSFVREIKDGPNGSPIISAVISMGKSLNQRIIAEGVETEQQLAFLRSQNCEEGQGFHFSRPLTADQFAALLRHQS